MLQTERMDRRTDGSTKPDTQTDRQGEILVQITELRLICLVKNYGNNFAVILGVILINILLRVS